MSFSFQASGHVEEEVQEKGIVVGLAQALGGVEGVTTTFSGRFFSGDVLQLAAQFEEDDRVANEEAAKAAEAGEGAPGSGEGVEEARFADDQSATSAQADQPAPDGSRGE